MRRFPVLLFHMTAVLLFYGAGPLCSLSARADATGDRRRAQLAKVQRVVLVPPFLGTDTLSRLDDPKARPEKGVGAHASR